MRNAEEDLPARLGPVCSRSWISSRSMRFRQRLPRSPHGSTVPGPATVEWLLVARSVRQSWKTRCAMLRGRLMNTVGWVGVRGFIPPGALWAGQGDRAYLTQDALGIAEVRGSGDESPRVKKDPPRLAIPHHRGRQMGHHLIGRLVEQRTPAQEPYLPSTQRSRASALRGPQPRAAARMEAAENLGRFTCGVIPNQLKEGISSDCAESSSQPQPRRNTWSTAI